MTGTSTDSQQSHSHVPDYTVQARRSGFLLPAGPSEHLMIDVSQECGRVIINFTARQSVASNAENVSISPGRHDGRSYY